MIADSIATNRWGRVEGVYPLTKSFRLSPISVSVRPGLLNPSISSISLLCFSPPHFFHSTVWHILLAWVDGSINVRKCLIENAPDFVRRSFYQLKKIQLSQSWISFESESFCFRNQIILGREKKFFFLNFRSQRNICHSASSSDKSFIVLKFRNQLHWHWIHRHLSSPWQVCLHRHPENRSLLCVFWAHASISWSPSLSNMYGCDLMSSSSEISRPSASCNSLFVRHE